MTNSEEKFKDKNLQQPLNIVVKNDSYKLHFVFALMIIVGLSIYFFQPNIERNHKYSVKRPSVTTSLGTIKTEITSENGDVITIISEKNENGKEEIKTIVLPKGSILEINELVSQKEEKNFEVEISVE